MTINLNQAETSRAYWEKARLKQAAEVVVMGSSQEQSTPVRNDVPVVEQPKAKTGGLVKRLLVTAIIAGSGLFPVSYGNKVRQPGERDVMYPPTDPYNL
jgi:hypothetical protein